MVYYFSIKISYIFKDFWDRGNVFSLQELNTRVYYCDIVDESFL